MSTGTALNMAMQNQSLDLKLEKTGADKCLCLNTIQATPNYPPYSLPVISQRQGGVFVFAGSIPHALSASLFAQNVFACDLDKVVVDLYNAAIAAMAKTPSRQRFAELFNILVGDVQTSKAAEERSVALGPRAYLPFLNHDEVYDSVRENVCKVKIKHGNIVDLLKELKSNGTAATVIDFNNVPEYIDDWSLLFAEPPLQRGGVVFFGKRDKTAYQLPDGKIHPGQLRKGIRGTYAAAPEGGTAIDVLKALESFGFKPFTAETVVNVTPTKSGARYDIRSINGNARINVLEERFAPTQSAGPDSRIVVGGTHNLFVAQCAR